MKPLFVLDKWCHGNKKNGLSAWEGNFVSSYKSLNRELDTFHHDDLRRKGEVNLNVRLVNLCKETRPTFIFLVIYELPSKSDDRIDLATIEEISKTCPIYTIFGDLEHIEQCNIAKKIEPYCRLVFFTALTGPGKRLKLSKFKYSWVPKDPSIFYPSGEKSFDVSYLGSPKPERLKVVNFLKKKGIPINCRGGERNDNLNIESYAEIIRKSKICLSFSRAGGNHVVNARVFEVIQSGALLLEQESLELPKIFVPYKHYIPYFNKNDLYHKIRFYLDNDAKRNRIIKDASKVLNSLFSAKRFWDEIAEDVLVGDEKKLLARRVFNCPIDYWSRPLYERDVPFFSLEIYSKFPRYKAIIYRIASTVSENNFLNFLFKIFYWLPFFPRRVASKIKQFILRSI